VVELFLAWWEGGRFASNPGWLPQNIENVEVIASDAAGSKLAVEHTRIHAFEGHQREEKWISQIGAQLEGAAELHSPGRRFSIIFYRDVFDDLNQKKRREYTQALIPWFKEKLPSLSIGIHRLAVPSLLPGKKPVEVEIEVDDFLDGLRPLSVSGMLPGDTTKRAAPQVDKVLATKLPKLSNSVADRKVLLVELPTMDTSTSLIIDLIKASTYYATQLNRIDYVVVAKTHTDQATGSAWFFAYDTRGYELGEVGCVTW
jgi:hypothetical protein